MSNEKTSEKCIDHLCFTNNTCEDCGLKVDAYGNTEDQFDYCSFPDCGCDGARLCMAGEPSEYACSGNVENMWSGKSPEQVRARNQLVTDVVNANNIAVNIINKKGVSKP